MGIPTNSLRKACYKQSVTKTQLETLAGVTGGTITASKAVVAGASGSLDLVGTQVKVVADDAVIGGIPVMHAVKIAAGANAAKNVVLTHKTKVVDAFLVLEGAGVASAVFTVSNNAAAITNAMAASAGDGTLVRAAYINDANQVIAAGGSLRVTGSAGATQPAATVYVLGYRVA